MIYVTLKPWGERGNGEDLRSIYETMSVRLSTCQDADARVLVPPPIQGLGLSGGFQMQVELTDGSLDFARLQAVVDRMVQEADAHPAIRMAISPLRASVPQWRVEVNRAQARTLNVLEGDVFDVLQTYIGSRFVNLFTRYGNNYMVFVQAEDGHRLTPENVNDYKVRSQDGHMVPLGSLMSVTPSHGPAVVSLYNLFPAAAINGAANPGFSSGQALEVMRGIAQGALEPGMQFEWTGLSYQEELAGGSAYFVFALAILLVYCVLAGQYESWIIPGAVILSVPLALLGTVAALSALGVANNTYVQIGLVLLIALSAKNAILIVEMARQGKAEGKDVVTATVDASRMRFRPIIMTSVTFILGATPLLLASGAGASARKSLGLAVVSGMLASTCLAVLFVPTFNVVLARWIDWRKSRSNAQMPSELKANRT
jgi:HAE1 family hydrophobic/amphiphilic exporter-1